MTHNPIQASKGSPFDYFHLQEVKRLGPLSKLGQASLPIGLVACLDLVDQGDRTTLPVDEWKRAESYRQETTRRQFITGRILIRRALGFLLKTAPQEVPLEISEFGKPVLASKGRNAFHFSIAHTQNHVFVAIAANQEIGVDLEHLRCPTRAQGVVEKFFTPNEKACLMQAQGEEKRWLFTRIWALKEALVKAEGRGLFQSAMAKTTDTTVFLNAPSFLRHPSVPYQATLCDLGLARIAAAVSIKMPEPSGSRAKPK